MSARALSSLAVAAVGARADDDRDPARARERPRRQQGGDDRSRRHGGRVLHRERPRRAVAPSRQPHRLPARRRRLSLVPRRAHRVEQRLVVHGRRCSEQPRLRRLHPPVARVPQRPARPDGAISGSSSSTYALVLTGSFATCCSRSIPTPRAVPGAEARSRSEAATASIRPHRRRDGSALALLVTVLVIVVSRFLRSPGALRRALGPSRRRYARDAGARAAGRASTALRGAARPLEYVFLVTFATVPLAFLAGVLRSRLSRSAWPTYCVELGQGTPLRDALAGALRDPSLDVVYWLPERERVRLARRHRVPTTTVARGRHVTSSGTGSRSAPSCTTRSSPTSRSSSTRSPRPPGSGWTTSACRPPSARSSRSSRRSSNASPSLLCSLNLEGGSRT